MLQARSLKDALVAMDRTVTNIKDIAAWHEGYKFLTADDLEAYRCRGGGLGGACWGVPGVGAWGGCLLCSRRPA